VDEQTHAQTGYDMILGRDFLCALGFVLDFEKRKVKWNGISVLRYSGTVRDRTLWRLQVSDRSSFHCVYALKWWRHCDKN